MDLVPFAIPFFLLAIAYELMLDRKRGTGYYRSNDAINSLSMGIISTTSKLIVFDISIPVFNWFANHLSIAQLPSDAAWVWIFSFVFYDLCYYWFHRISHERKLFWAAHVSHHQSEEYNLTTALRQTSMGFVASWVFYIPCFMLGIPAFVFFTVASANLIYQFWVHTRFVPKLGWYEWFFVSPSNHRVHHARNAEYVDKNYGGVFIIWDRLFGTFQEEKHEIEPEYGILKALNSWNPLWANVHIYADMIRDTFRAKGKDRWRIWWGRTDFIPEGLDAPQITLGTRFNPVIDQTTRLYVGYQFICALGLSTAIIFLSQYASPAVLVTGVISLMICLASIGILMEGRGEVLELARLGISLAVFSQFSGATMAIGLLYCLLSLALFSTTLVKRNQERRTEEILQS